LIPMTGLVMAKMVDYEGLKTHLENRLNNYKLMVKAEYPRWRTDEIKNRVLELVYVLLDLDSFIINTNKESTNG
jgi:hypothetical protein